MATKNTDDLVQQLKSAFASRDRMTINGIILDLLARDAQLGTSWRTFAEVMLTNGELDAARRAIRAYVQSTGGHPRARFEEAAVMARSGQEAQARALLQSLPDDLPDPVANAFMRGTLALNLGERDEAIDHLQRATSLNPASGQSWLGLAMAMTADSHPDLADKLLAAEQAIASAPPIDRVQYQYARGKILHEQASYSEAFAAWTAGGEMASSLRPYQADADCRSAHAAVEGFDADLLRQYGRQVSSVTGRPIFVTGLPRSGTTLVEQILASHSAVAGGTELGKFGLLLERVGGASAAALGRWVDRGQSLDALTSDYLHLFDERFGTSGRAVDKTPDASRYLGIAAAILPDTPIIWMRRDRLDGAFSCFRTYFMHGADWSHRQDSIAAHFRLEDELLDRWQDILGSRLLVVDYAALVKDPQAVIPTILDRCGLSPDQAVFSPHMTQRVVTTSSVAQVREPINLKGLGNAEPYRAQMQPFIDAYRRLGGEID